jgi:excisionase family DNA binding protein
MFSAADAADLLDRNDVVNDEGPSRTRPGGGNVKTNGEYLRTAEVARLLRVSPKTVSRWAKEGRLPFVTTLGGHRRYPAQRIYDLVGQLAHEGVASLDY